MSRLLDFGAIARGAAFGVPLVLVASLVNQLLESDDEGSAATFPLFVLMLAGFVVAGYVAARAVADAPYSNGALAALAAFLVVQAIAVASRIVRDESLQSVSAVAFLGLLAYASGLVGALLASRRGDPSVRSS